MPHRVIKSIDGRRGGALTLIAVMFLAVGLGNFRPRETRSAILAWLPEWIGNGELGWCLTVLAAVALLAALVSKWSKRALALGFQCALAGSLIMSALYGVASVTGGWGYVSLAVIFATFACLIYSISAWDDARSRPPLTGEQRRVLGEGE